MGAAALQVVAGDAATTLSVTWTISRVGTQAELAAVVVEVLRAATQREDKVTAVEARRDLHVVVAKRVGWRAVDAAMGRPQAPAGPLHALSAHAHVALTTVGWRP